MNSNHSIQKPVLARCRNILLVLALLAATGAQWAALQSIAWARMLAEHLREDSFAKAMACTFDGKHPCALCKAIAAGKKSEKKNEFQVLQKKLEFPPAAESVILTAPVRFQFVPIATDFSKSLSPKPPTPPPRATCA